MKIVFRSVDPVSGLIDLKIAWLDRVSSSVSLCCRRSSVAFPVWHRWKKVISYFDEWIQIAGQSVTWWIETTCFLDGFSFLGWWSKIVSVKFGMLFRPFVFFCCWALVRLGFCPLIKFREKRWKLE